MPDSIDELKRDIVFPATLRGNDFTFHSTWGLFSPERIDAGTALLINAVEVRPTDTLLDLGCGYGAIGLALAKLAPRGALHMVDKDFVAIEYAKKNAGLNHARNATAYLSNGLSHVPDAIRFDHIVSNLPAKASKEFYQILFFDAKRFLKPAGSITIVTITGLKEFIKRKFRETFGNYTKLAQTPAGVVASATMEIAE